MPVTIQILEGESGQNGQELDLNKSTILIGRGEDQDVRLTNDSVSARHCVVEKRDGQWRVIDEESRNGTFVNGQRVPKQRVLHHEDVIELGEVMLRIGLDRKLRDEKSRRGAPALPMIVRAISGVVIAVVVSLLLVAMVLLWNYSRETGRITTRLPVRLAPAESRVVFAGTPDERTLGFQWLASLPDWLSKNTSYYDNPMPDWSLGDIWSTELAGMHPRMFEGLDLDLAGGDQIVLSGYFFTQRQFILRDASDPMGVIYMELEGWSGFGRRYANKQAFPIVRRPELPRYTRSLVLDPAVVQDIPHDDWRDVQLATFSRVKRLLPPAFVPGLAAIVPSGSERLITAMVAAPQPKDVRFDNKHYTFFKDGNLYGVTIGGTTNLLNRFEGGLDALASTLLDGIKIDPTAERKPPPADEVARRMQEMNTMLLAASRKPIVLDAITYPALKKVRDLLLDLQSLTEPVPDEQELRRLYFDIVGRVQNDLLISATRIYDGRRNTRSPEGERELSRIRDFLSGYPPLTLRRGDLGYPEWVWYYEDVVEQAPYTSMRNPGRKR